MSLKERFYSVLLVSAAQNFNKAFFPLLSPSRFEPVITVTDISAAKRAVHERSYDLVIVNSPLPDSDGMRFAIDLGSGSRTSVILMILRAEIYDDIYPKAVRHGVFTLARPFSRTLVSTALDWLVCERERLRIYEQKSVSVEEKMEEIRLVNRAKWLLIRQLHMEEPAAHRYIEKQAMDRCVPKREVAEEIIRTYA